MMHQEAIHQIFPSPPSILSSSKPRSSHRSFQASPYFVLRVSFDLIKEKEPLVM